MSWKSTVAFAQLTVFVLACSKQMPVGAGVRKASADGWFQIFYLTDNVALLKHMQETGLRSLPMLVQATPFKPTFFQEDYSTGDTIGKILVENVWKIGISGTNIVFGIRLAHTSNVFEKVYFVVEEDNARFFTKETEWKTCLAANTATTIHLRVTSKVAAGGSVRGIDLPAWNEPVIEGFDGTADGDACP